MSNLKELRDSLKQNDKERIDLTLRHNEKLRELDSNACDLTTRIDKERARIEEEFKQVKKDWEDGLYDKGNTVDREVHLAWRAETDKHSLSVVREIRKKGYSIYVKYGIFQEDISCYKKKTEREDYDKINQDNTNLFKNITRVTIGKGTFSIEQLKELNNYHTKKK